MKLKRKSIREIHGLSKHPLYAVWATIKQRVYNTDSPNYRYYGGRGIKMCDRWRDSFINFYEDIGEPSNGKTLDRIDNDGDYEPDNVRWATRSQQQFNQRLNSRNTSGYKGVYATMNGRWQVRYGKANIGTFLTLPEAISARKRAESLNRK